VAGLQPGRDGRVGRYLRTNDRVWTPPCLITFDTEATRHQRADGEDQALRLWCARLDDRRTQKWRERANLTARGHTGAQLAKAVDDWLARRLTAWLYCHNLGYDLVTSQLVEHLCYLGWSVESCSSNPEYLFLAMAKGEHRLTLTDLHHLIPARLASIGSMVGLDKMRTPGPEATEADWFTYCGRDVDVTAEAVLALMAHWDDYGLGNWSLSGASCGFRAMRHTLGRRSITLIEDPDGSANDRAAIYGGRRYCWRHGAQPLGRYTEVDYTQAHATTAASWPMPVKRGPWFPALDPGHMAVDGKYAIVIAEVEIECDRPRYPCRVGGRVWYPVGRFRTVMASPEIAWARDNGDLVSIGRGQFHYTSRVLAPFFGRVLETSLKGGEATPPIVAAMWRQWGRSVVGKFAQRGYRLEQTRMLTDRAWYYERATDAESGTQYWLVHYNGHIYRAIPEGDGAQAYPAVLALVESYERVAIGQAAELFGDQVVIQCDTDGVWIDAGALEMGAPTGLGFDLGEVPRQARIDLAVDVVNNLGGPLKLRPKHSAQRFAVWGPQNIDAEAHTKHSGRPARLTEVSPGVWTGEIFPSVARQMARGADGVYRTEQVTWTRPANAVPGWVLADGAVRPVETVTDAAGAVQLRPWPATRWAAYGHRLGPVQHQALDGLWDLTRDSGNEADDAQSQEDAGANQGRPRRPPQGRQGRMGVAPSAVLSVPTRPA
jgi:hypothetical protein